GQAGERRMGHRVVADQVPGGGDLLRLGRVLVHEGAGEEERRGDPLPGQGGEDRGDRGRVGPGVEGERDHLLVGGQAFQVPPGEGRREDGRVRAGRTRRRSRGGGEARRWAGHVRFRCGDGRGLATAGYRHRRGEGGRDERCTGTHRWTLRLLSSQGNA